LLQTLLDQVRQEERAARDAASGVDTKRLDQEFRELRKMNLRPAAMAAAVQEIERERAELLAVAEMTGTGDLNAPLGGRLWAHARLSLCIR
jgi:hypothetical protein